MKWRRWIKYLLPEEEQSDPVFRRELDQLAAVGLRVIAGVCVGAPLFSMISFLWLEEAREFFSFGAAFGILIWGLSEVVLEIKDDGRGIPSDRLAHLFDPSFRVEGSRVSTNWGLFTSRSIVADHGGQIEIASTEGLGTTAKISLPITGMSSGR